MNSGLVSAVRTLGIEERRRIHSETSRWQQSPSGGNPRYQSGSDLWHAGPAKFVKSIKRTTCPLDQILCVELPVPDAGPPLTALLS